MGNTITIKLRNKKARTIIKGLEELKAIEILHDDNTANWSPRKKQQAKIFFRLINRQSLLKKERLN